MLGNQLESEERYVEDLNRLLKELRHQNTVKYHQTTAGALKVSENSAVEREGFNTDNVAGF